MYWNWNRTSSAVNGVPSDQVTPGRIWYVQVRPSSLTPQLSARPGAGSRFGPKPDEEVVLVAEQQVVLGDDGEVRVHARSGWATR